jgi:hypothetical protein
MVKTGRLLHFYRTYAIIETMSINRTEKRVSIEHDKALLSDYAAMLHDVFELLEPIRPDAEEVSIGKFVGDEPSDAALQFSLGYEEDRIFGFIGTTRDNGDTYDAHYRRNQSRELWENTSTGNPASNIDPLTVLANIGFGNSTLPDRAARLLHLLGQQDSPTDRDVFDAASVVFAPHSSAVRRLKRYDFADIRLDDTNTSQVEFSIYRIIDNGEELVQARMMSSITRNEIPCTLECLYNDDEYGEPSIELRIHGDGIDERIEPDSPELVVHELMSMLYKLVKEKRDRYLETNRQIA